MEGCGELVEHFQKHATISEQKFRIFFVHNDDLVICLIPFLTDMIDPAIGTGWDVMFVD